MKNLQTLGQELDRDLTNSLQLWESEERNGEGK